MLPGITEVDPVSITPDFIKDFRVRARDPGICRGPVPQPCPERVRSYRKLLGGVLQRPAGLDGVVESVAIPRSYARRDIPGRHHCRRPPFRAASQRCRHPQMVRVRDNLGAVGEPHPEAFVICHDGRGECHLSGRAITAEHLLAR